MAFLFLIRLLFSATKAGPGAFATFLVVYKIFITFDDALGDRSCVINQIAALPSLRIRIIIP